ncbi:VOC family protein [Glycomyces endophyticus]|uniref:VOC family protein n=1 Tax=Glycomyces endophyticus TaxID=480996 RepID=A0ABN2HKE8_9ACTN
MSGTRLSLTSITVTAPDPRALADFYARLLGTEVAVSEPPGADEPPEAGWAQVRTDGPTLNFEYERHWQAPVWPAAPGRPHATQHLDVHVDDLPVAVAHAVEQGARLADFQPQDDVRVLFDPAGHPFCLFL